MAKKKTRHNVEIAVIGGSGVYELDGLSNIEEVKVNTPFGKPSDAIILGDVDGVRCAFLPRHARGHRILPNELNSRANIFALKTLGVKRIISVSACGSLKEELKPKDFVVPDQLFDRTKNRPGTFFGEGIVAHVSMAPPFCCELRQLMLWSLKEIGISHHDGGTYVCIDGPQFSTKAESDVNRAHGFSIVGMTAIPEAKLAREAEICYATVGLITDYDVWKEGEEVSVDMVMANMHANVSNSKKLLKNLIPKIATAKFECNCADALKYAVMSKLDSKNKKTLLKLKPIMGKYIK